MLLTPKPKRNRKALTVQSSLVRGPGGELAIKHTQEITPQFMNHIKVLQELAQINNSDEDLHVCRVPRFLVEKWKSEGFDCTTSVEDDPDALKERLREMVRRLRAEGYENFIISKKTF